MKSSRIQSIVLALSLLILMSTSFYSCKNDLEVNAPYKSYPIVYALINQYDSVQTIKITRSFLGEEDPNNYAQIPDSSDYSEVNAFVDEYRYGEKTKTYPLVSKKITNKNSGTFYSPTQTVYVFETTRKGDEAEYLNPRSEYELNATLDEETTIKSRTKMIEDVPNFFFQKKMQQQLWRKTGSTKSQGNIKFATSSKILDGLSVEAELPVNCKLAEMKMIFYYREITKVNGQLVEEVKSIDYAMGRVIVDEPGKVNKQNFTVTGQRFFEKIVTSMPDAGEVENFHQRIADKCDFEVIMVNDDFYTYVQVTQPSDDLNQNKPQFTNIEGGYGIFAARVISKLSQQTVRKTGEDLSGLLNADTQAELVTGLLGGGTATKGFCMDPEIAAGSSYGYLKCEQ